MSEQKKILRRSKMVRLLLRLVLVDGPSDVSHGTGASTSSTMSKHLAFHSSMCFAQKWIVIMCDMVETVLTKGRDGRLLLYVEYANMVIYSV